MAVLEAGVGVPSAEFEFTGEGDGNTFAVSSEIDFFGGFAALNFFVTKIGNPLLGEAVAAKDHEATLGGFSARAFVIGPLNLTEEGFDTG